MVRASGGSLGPFENCTANGNNKKNGGKINTPPHTSSPLSMICVPLWHSTFPARCENWFFYKIEVLTGLPSSCCTKWRSAVGRSNNSHIHRHTCFVTGMRLRDSSRESNTRQHEKLDNFIQLVRFRSSLLHQIDLLRVRFLTRTKLATSVSQAHMHRSIIACWVCLFSFFLVCVEICNDIKLHDF